MTNPLLTTSPEAWDRLIEEVEPAGLLLVIERRLSDALKGAFTAEDILQEAFLHAWRDRARFEWRGLRSFRSWLLTIIDHRIRDAADWSAAAKRRAPGEAPAAAREGADGSTASGEQLPAGSTTPSKVAIYREQAEVMRQALDALPEECREIVRLRLLERQPVEEIAAALGLGVSAVRHRFRKGAERYAQLLRAALGSRPSSCGPESPPPRHPLSSPP
jgi:RNA polymerase sigma factor (sigma-70 family)